VTLPSEAHELAELQAQEQRLLFDGFDNEMAWELGSQMVAAARDGDLSVVISISRGGQRVFHAALPGTSPDNDDWVERKSRVVQRFGHSSLYMGTQARMASSTFQDRTGLDPALYAAHGGSFPIAVRRIGVVGTVTVSGLAQLDDHSFVVEQLTLYLGRRQARPGA
jgi:uncharacterized protein (UPF0303 family)